MANMTLSGLARAFALTPLVGGILLSCGGRGDDSSSGDGDGDGDVVLDYKEPDDPPAVITGGDNCELYSSDCSEVPDGAVCVPAGFFTMGADEQPYGQDIWPGPVRTVCMPTFFIQTLEVTVAEYRACVDGGQCDPPFGGSSCNWDAVGRDAHPMNCLAQRDAENYCSFIGMRLPTEAEWEKAARGTDARRYPWGNDPPDCSLAHYQDGAGLAGCGTDTTAPVGSYPAGASPYGALDMLGNVQEWVSDSVDEQSEYDPTQLDNPQGDSGDYRGLRGGSYVHAHHDTRFTTFHRSWGNTGDRYHTNGVRCASSPEMLLSE